MEKTETRKWRWGVNRWWVLLLIVLSIVAVSVNVAVLKPVQPTLSVAPEKLIKEPLFNLGPLGDFYLYNTVPALIIGDLLLIGLALAVRRAAKSGSLVPKGISGAMEALFEVVYNLTETSAGKHAKIIFPWFMTILLIVMVANLVKLFPGFETIGLLEHAEGSIQGYEVQHLFGNLYGLTPEKASGEEAYFVEPFLRGVSTDLNFTAALALIAVVMIQVVGVQTQGIRYFSKFLNFTTMFKKPFFGFMDFIVGLLETISELSKILSFAFRLFGNMFAGMVLVALVGAMVPIFVPSMIFMFEFFIGAIQAFVFGMLTMVFMSQATKGHGGEGHESQEAEAH